MEARQLRPTPASLGANTPVPLVLALHGGTGWGEQFQCNSGFDGIAEANQFLVVYPDGVPLTVKITPDGRTWNGGIMSYRLACERADTIHSHGSAEENAPYDGGRGAHSISGADSRAARELSRMLAEGNGCAATHTDMKEGPVTTIDWDGCPPGNGSGVAGGRSESCVDGASRPLGSGRGRRWRWIRPPCPPR